MCQSSGRTKYKRAMRASFIEPNGLVAISMYDHQFLAPRPPCVPCAILWATNANDDSVFLGSRCIISDALAKIKNWRFL